MPTPEKHLQSELTILRNDLVRLSEQHRQQEEWAINTMFQRLERLVADDIDAAITGKVYDTAKPDIRRNPKAAATVVEKSSGGGGSSSDCPTPSDKIVGVDAAIQKLDPSIIPASPKSEEKTPSELSSTSNSLNLPRLMPKKEDSVTSISSLTFAFTTSLDPTKLARHSSLAYAPASMPELFLAEAKEHKGILWRCIERCLTWWTKDVVMKPGALAAFVVGRKFEILCVTVIILNSGFVLASLNRDIQNLNTAPPAYFMHVEIAFFAFYTVELLLRMYVHGVNFVRHKNAMWNLFDAVLVFCSVFEFAFSALSGSDGGVNVAFLRVIRLLKVAKILRVARALRTVRQLRLFLVCLSSCAMALFWALALICFLCILFAMYFLQAVALFLFEQKRLGTLDKELEVKFRKLYGSVVIAMTTMLECVCGGRDWAEVYELLAITGRGHGIVFIFCVLFFQVAVWNIVTSVFIDHSLELAKPDIETQMMEKRMRDIRDTHELMDMCKIFHFDESGKLSLNDLRAWLADTTFKSYFDVRGIDVKDVDLFFKMLSTKNSSGELEVDFLSFVGGALRLKGVATSLDLHSLYYEMKAMKHQQTVFYNNCRKKFRNINSKFANIDSALSVVSGQNQSVFDSMNSFGRIINSAWVETGTGDAMDESGDGDRINSEDDCKSSL